MICSFSLCQWLLSKVLASWWLDTITSRSIQSSGYCSRRQTAWTCTRCPRGGITFVNTLGAKVNPNGRALNWNTRSPWYVPTANQSRCGDFLCMHADVEVTILEVDTRYPMRCNTLWVVILNFSLLTKWLRNSKSNTGRQSPSFLRTKNIQLSNPGESNVRSSFSIALLSSKDIIAWRRLCAFSESRDNCIGIGTGERSGELSSFLRYPFLTTDLTNWSVVSLFWPRNGEPCLVKPLGCAQMLLRPQVGPFCPARHDGELGRQVG